MRKNFVIPQNRTGHWNYLSAITDCLLYFSVTKSILMNCRSKRYLNSLTLLKLISSNTLFTFILLLFFFFFFFITFQQSWKVFMHSVCLSDCPSVYSLSLVNNFQMSWNRYMVFMSNIALDRIENGGHTTIGSYTY